MLDRLVESCTSLLGSKLFSFKFFSFYPLFFKSLIKSPNFAFTIAEVLIVIGIIGIVAEITIPSVYTEFKKQMTITQLQKAYSNLNQVLTSTLSDNVLNPSISGDRANLFDKMNFNTNWAPYLKTTCIYNPPETCGYAVDQRISNGMSSTVFATTKCPTTTTLILQDGSTLGIGVCLSSSRSNYAMETFLIDLNGPKGPNKGGVDVFLFSFDGSGKLIGYGTSGIDDCAVNLTKGGCAQKIIDAGWRIEDDYPW